MRTDTHYQITTEHQRGYAPCQGSFLVTVSRRENEYESVAICNAEYFGCSRNYPSSWTDRQVISALLSEHATYLVNMMEVDENGKPLATPRKAVILKYEEVANHGGIYYTMAAFLYDSQTMRVDVQSCWGLSWQKAHALAKRLPQPINGPHRVYAVQVRPSVSVDGRTCAYVSRVV